MSEDTDSPELTRDEAIQITLELLNRQLLKADQLTKLEIIFDKYGIMESDRTALADMVLDFIPVIQTMLPPRTQRQADMERLRMVIQQTKEKLSQLRATNTAMSQTEKNARNFLDATKPLPPLPPAKDRP